MVHITFNRNSTKHFLIHYGPWRKNHSKFKSNKKQNFTNFQFLYCETLIDLIKGPHKRKNQSSKKWLRNGRRFLGLSGSTLRPSCGQNKRFFQNFFIMDPRSAQKTGRFDILTSKTNFFLKSWSCVAVVGIFLENDSQIPHPSTPFKNVQKIKLE